MRLERPYPPIESLREMAEEFRAEGDDRFRAVLEDPTEYLQAAWRDENDVGLDPSRVGQSHFLLVDPSHRVGGRPAGRLNHLAREWRRDAAVLDRSLIRIGEGA